jgi:hypothetical protein
MSSFLDKVKANVQEAATAAKEGIEELQLKRDLGSAYGDLGRAVFDLVDKGELANPALDAPVERVRSLRAELEAARTKSEEAPATAE